jgi:deoxyribonuclease V
MPESVMTVNSFIIAGLSDRSAIAYNKTMQSAIWQCGAINSTEACRMQLAMADKVIKTGGALHPRYIAGVDISVESNQKKARAAAVVLNYPSLELEEVAIAHGELNFPYIPGLLSFREVPLITEAYQKLFAVPDLLMVDGQGLAHPRRMGLACHLGLLLDIPAIGCAKSRLCGECSSIGEYSGSQAALIDGEEIIGAAMRSKTGAKPLYISIGHKISLEDAVLWVSLCLKGYHLPEPTRLAHLAAGNKLRIQCK